MTSTKAEPKPRGRRAAAPSDPPKRSRAKAPQEPTARELATAAAARTRTVGEYLRALARQEAAPKRRDTPEALKAKISSIVKKVAEPNVDPLVRVKLIQDELDLRQALEHSADEEAFDTREQAVIPVLAQWAEANKVTYVALRSVGVPTRVLREAGVPRNRYNFTREENGTT